MDRNKKILIPIVYDVYLSIYDVSKLLYGCKHKYIANIVTPPPFS